MGFANSKDTRKTYARIVGGKFAIYAEPNQEGAVSRINKENKEVWEFRYDTLEKVLIKKIEKYAGERDINWNITVADVDEQIIIVLPYAGRITSGLLRRLPNVDFAKPVTLKLFTNKEGLTYLTIYDWDNSKIEAAHSKENPNGMPDAEPVKRAGVDKWDYSKQEEFLENMITTIVIPKLTALTEFPAPDDLPF